MSAHQPPAERRRRSPHRRLKTLAATVLLPLLLLMFLPLAGPVAAEPDLPDLLEENPTYRQSTDIVITSLGAGASVRGALPPVGQTWPITSYPTRTPAGYETNNVGFAGIINTQDSSGTNSAQMYCIDLRTETQVGLGYVNGTWSEANVPNIGYVESILNSYFPSTQLPAGVNDNRRAAAVQSAIWYFTDGFVVNRNDPAYSLVAEIVNATIAAGPRPEPAAPDISITPASAQSAIDEPAGPFTVEAEAGAEITVGVDDGFSLFADAAGTVPLNNPVASGTQVWVGSDGGGTGPVSVTAAAVVTVPTGNVYLYDGSTAGTTAAQKLILAATRQLTSGATAQASFYEFGSLSVTKAIAGEAAGSQGAVVISIDCGAGNQFTFDVPAGTTGAPSQTFTSIPVGSTCTITEPTDGSSTSVSVTADLPGPVTIVSGATSTATVTDTYDFTPGTLVVRKVIAGEAAGAQGEVQISVVCTSGGATVLDTTVTVAAEDTDPAPFEFPGLASGASCEVTETVDGGSTAVSVTVAGGGTVTIPAGDSAESTLTDTYEFTPGTLAVRKDIAGEGAGLQGDVVLQVVCTSGGVTVLDESVTVPAGTTEPTPTEYTGLASGAACTVTETASGANTQVSVTTVVDPEGGTVTVPAGDGVEVTVTNTYALNPGSLTVNKEITGFAAGQQAEVVLQVTCTRGGAPTLDRTITIPAGTTGVTGTTITDIPANSACEVTEPTTGETAELAVGTDLPDTVTIPAGGALSATVTNTYSLKPGTILFTKFFSGEAAGTQGDVQVEVTCIVSQLVVLQETFQAPAGATDAVVGRYPNIPAGSSCSITEPVTGATQTVDVDYTLPDPVMINPGALSSAEFTNTYTFAPGTVTVTKVIAGAAAGKQDAVVLDLSCTLGEDAVLDTSITVAARATGEVSSSFGGLAAGTKCSVVERATGRDQRPRGQHRGA